jgi:hypothetical protein
MLARRMPAVAAVAAAVSVQFHKRFVLHFRLVELYRQLSRVGGALVSLCLQSPDQGLVTLRGDLPRFVFQVGIFKTAKSFEV